MNLKVIIKKIAENSIGLLFDLVDKLVCKKKYIVFSARAAKGYADNSKILYEKFIQEGIEEVFYFTKNKNELRKIPKNGIYAYSIKAIYIMLKSRILVFTHGSNDFFPYSPSKHPNRIFINLFHAIAVKNVDITATPKGLRETRKWDYFVVSSEFEQEYIKNQLLLKDSQMLNFGHPRNDILIKKPKLEKQNETKLVLYAPTFRDTNITKLFPFKDVELQSLDDFLNENDIKIMIRLHINEELKYKEDRKYQNLKNIYFEGSDKIPSINDFLHNVDMLISDYSSITLDYLLLNKPIAYIPYDYEKYNEERGFSFDYFKYLAGPTISSQKDLKAFLLMSNDNYAEKKKTLKNLFHNHQDGRSTERLFNFIYNL